MERFGGELTTGRRTLAACALAPILASVVGQAVVVGTEPSIGEWTDLARAARSTRPENVAAAVALAHEATHAQRVAAGLNDHVVGPAPDVDLATSVRSLAQRYRIAAPDSFFGPYRDDASLARVISHFLAFDDAARARDVAAILPARDALLDAALELAMRPRATADSADCDTLFLPPALAIDAAGCDSVYADNVALLVDVGGNDIYLNNAGGNNLDEGSCFPLDGIHAAAALIDLSGNDNYVGGRHCGANGGARDGAGFLFDASGDDVYEAAYRGTNGGGTLGGVGFLLDASGNDRYVAESYATNGGADTGLGLLLDAGGNDVYVAGPEATNGGGWGGVGMLIDLDGDDRYEAGNYATNGGAIGGGKGLLLDARGDDRYAAGTVAVNGGGNLGTGILFDGDGTDTYFETDDYCFEATLCANGSGTDRTVVPKAWGGAQVDWPIRVG